MNDDQIDDLKQFIATTISQQTSDLREDISDIREDLTGVKADIKRLDQKIDDVDAKVDLIATSIGQTFEEDQAKTQVQLDDHEQRITRLEHKAA